MKNICVTIAFALSVIALPVHANLTTKQMQQYMDSKYCPADLRRFELVSYDDRNCRTKCAAHGYGANICQNCMNQVGRDNEVINRFNNFLRKCRASRNG